MRDGGNSTITRFLHDWSKGDESAKEQLLPVIYDELKRQARVMMSREAHQHTLQPTALVHEVYLKLSNGKAIEWQDRAHFFGFASRLMREVLIDHARRNATMKRGKRQFRFSLDDVQIPFEERADSLVHMDEALKRLEQMDARQARIVEMRFFGGMTGADIAKALQVSERTVAREWESARLWLFRELNG